MNWPSRIIRARITKRAGHPSRRGGRFLRRPLAAGLVAAATIAGLLSSGPLAGATPTYKLYSDSAQTNPSTVYEGVATTVTFTFTNSANSNQPFGSAEITVGTLPADAVGTVTTDNTAWSGSVIANTDPAVIKLTSTSGIAPNSSLNVTFTITPNSASPITLTTVVKQSNDFSGTGNNFRNSGSDPLPIQVTPFTLSFVTPPSDVQQFSTGAPGTPVLYMCNPVSVSVKANGTGVSGVAVTLTYDGTNPDLIWNGQPVSSTNPLTVTSGDGIATFGTCSLGIGATRIGSGYTLVASAGNVSSMPSSTFSVVQTLTDCPASTDGTTPVTCSATANSSSINNLSGSTSVTFGAAGGKLVGSFGLGDNLSASCTSNVTKASVTVDPLMTETPGTAASGVVSMTFPKSVVNNLANNGTPLMQVCAGASEPFQGSNRTPLPGPYPYQGLLPDCQTGYANVVDNICVLSRSKHAANETITIFVSDLSDPSFW